MPDISLPIALLLVAASLTAILAAAALAVRRPSPDLATRDAARDLTADLRALPGRLRRLARDPRTPRSARWWLIGLPIYIANPIDLIPDFIPVIGLLDEALLVPLVLRRLRHSIPDEVWREHFPPPPGARFGARTRPRPGSGSRLTAGRRAISLSAGGAGRRGRRARGRQFPAHP